MRRQMLQTILVDRCKLAKTKIRRERRSIVAPRLA